MKKQEKLRLHKIARASKISLIASFILLVGIAITGAARALTLVSIANENGIPSAWKVSSVGNPDTITVPITYFDQKMDSCNAKVRQFEWCGCSGQCIGSFQQGIVKNYLGVDGLPIPSFSTQTASAAAGINRASQWVIGSEPVTSSDNFYRWYHEVAGVSKAYERELTFNRIGNTNRYQYGGTQIFPLDSITKDSDSVSKNDSNARQHNFSFTAHMTVPIKVEMTGDELFEFSGDDDVWVFLNGVLVMDLGGLHSKLDGNFLINEDGSISSTVQNVGTTYIDAGLKKGRVYNMDFFYAERSTSEANTLITISNMNWPIAADANVDGEILENSVISYNSYLKNIDTENELYLTHLSSYLFDEDGTAGYIPLNGELVSYTYTPEDENSWLPLVLTAPGTDLNSFRLLHNLMLGRAGSSTDTLYFRYNVVPDSADGVLSNKISYLTENRYGDVGISYDVASVEFEHLDPVVPITEPVTPTDEPKDEPTDEPTDEPGNEPSDGPTDEPGGNPGTDEPKDEPTDEPEEPSNPETPVDMSNATILTDAEFTYLEPLGVIAYAPETGVITRAAAEIFNQKSFSAIILSQSFVLAILGVFALSFTVYFPLRNF